MSKIYFQGSYGAYSHLAALSIDPKAEIIPCKTFDECFLKALNEEVKALEKARPELENQKAALNEKIEQLNITKTCFLGDGSGLLSTLVYSNCNIKSSHHIDLSHFLVKQY